MDHNRGRGMDNQGMDNHVVGVVGVVVGSSGVDSRSYSRHRCNRPD